MKHKLIIIVLLTALFLNSCKKDSTSIQEIESGIYKGTFTVDYDGKKYSASDIEVVFNSDNTYLSTANRNPRIPAGGNGTYTIKNNYVLFIDENPWTTEFDPGLILSGEYKIKLNNKNLILTKKYKGDNTNTVYEYNLIKQ